jgi:hypothetical protein
MDVKLRNLIANDTKGDSLAINLDDLDKLTRDNKKADVAKIASKYKVKQAA